MLSEPCGVDGGGFQVPFAFIKVQAQIVAEMSILFYTMSGSFIQILLPTLP